LLSLNEIFDHLALFLNNEFVASLEMKLLDTNVHTF